MDVKKKRPSENDLAKADERASERDSASIPLFFSIGLSVLSAAVRSGVPGGTIKARGGGRKSAMGHGKKTPQFLAHPNRSTPQALDYSDSSPTHSLAIEREMGFTETAIRQFDEQSPAPYLINRCECIRKMFPNHVRNAAQCTQLHFDVNHRVKDSIFLARVEFSYRPLPETDRRRQAQQR